MIKRQPFKIAGRSLGKSINHEIMKKLLLLLLLVGIIPITNAQNCVSNFSLSLGTNPGEVIFTDNSTVPSGGHIERVVSSNINSSLNTNGVISQGTTETYTLSTDDWFKVYVHVYSSSGWCTFTRDSIYVNTTSVQGNCNANFNATVSSGVPNHISVVAPTNNTYNNTYQWDFGDGTVVTTSGYYGYYSSHTYSQSGTYTVQLTVNNPNGYCSDVHTQSVTVNSTCDASFSTSTVSWNPYLLEVQATGVNYNGTQYNWDFGDGTVITGGSVNESHTYTSVGTFTVELEVVGPNGSCTDVQTQTFTTYYSCDASAYVYSQANGGVAVNNSSYTDDPNGLITMDVTGPNNYSQQFTLQNQTNFNFNVPENGVYNYTINVTGGCQSSITGTVTVNSIPAPPVCDAEFDFSYKSNQFYLDYQSVLNSNSLSHEWDYGDGSTSSYTYGDVSHPYAQPDVYTVTHVVNGSNMSGTCTDTFGVNIEITPYQCTGGFEPIFVNNALYLNMDYYGYQPSYSIDYGDGSSAVTAVGAAVESLSHSYANYGTYNVCVTVSDSICSDTYCESVVYDNTTANSAVCTADFTVVPDPNNASLIYVVDNSQGDNLEYVWDFGDGSYSYYYQYPTHTYANIGTFTINLDVAYNALSMSDNHSDVVVVTTKSLGTTVEVVPSISFTGLEEDHVFAELSIYPNPSTDGKYQLLFNSTINENIDLMVYGVNGQQITSKSLALHKGETTDNLDLSHLNAGVYFISLTNESGVQKIYRVVKQ